MTICPNCNRVYTPDLVANDSAATASKLRRWKEGEFVQNIWPNATPAQREQIVTGLCSDKCWDDYFGVSAPNDIKGLSTR